MKRLMPLLARLSNAMLLGLLVLLYVDGRNPYIQFLTSAPSMVYLLIMCLLGLTVSAYVMIRAKK